MTKALRTWLSERGLTALDVARCSGIARRDMYRITVKVRIFRRSAFDVFEDRLCRDGHTVNCSVSVIRPHLVVGYSNFTVSCRRRAKVRLRSDISVLCKAVPSRAENSRHASVADTDESSVPIFGDQHRVFDERFAAIGNFKVDFIYTE